MRRVLFSFMAVCLLSAVAVAQEHKISVQKFEPPMYPPIARQARIAGEVKLALEVAADGSVTDVKVVSGHPMLRRAAVENVKLWRFHCDDCAYGAAFHHEISYIFHVDSDSTSIPHVSYLFPNKLELFTEETCICDPPADITQHSWMWRLFHRHRTIVRE